jgi:hypothetical protein
MKKIILPSLYYTIVGLMFKGTVTIAVCVLPFITIRLDLRSVLVLLGIASLAKLLGYFFPLIDSILFAIMIGMAIHS